MPKVAIKTPDGKYVGGGSRETELVDRITRAYLYEDGPDVDTQISIVNAVHGWQWKKVDAEQEYDRQLAGAGP